MTDVQDLFEIATRASETGTADQEDINASEAALTPLPDDVSQSIGEVGYIARHDPQRRPVGMTAKELDAALDKLERMAFILDSKWQLGQTPVRVGVDSVVGMIPVVGDVLTTGYAAYIVLKAARLGMPAEKQRKLWFRVAKDSVFGSVPILGTVFDIWYKANERNVDDILTWFGRPPLAVQRAERKAWEARQSAAAAAQAGAPGTAPGYSVGQPPPAVATFPPATSSTLSSLPPYPSGSVQAGGGYAGGGGAPGQPQQVQAGGAPPQGQQTTTQGWLNVLRTWKSVTKMVAQLQTAGSHPAGAAPGGV